MIPIRVFCSYAHNDERLQKELEKHLSILKYEGLITSWYDRDISAGAEWKREIDIHLNTSQIILLLVSANFIASEYCYSVETMKAIERHDAGEARVIPIILRPVDWRHTLLGKLQALPKDGKPVMRWHPQGDAFVDISRGIRKAIKELEVLKMGSNLAIKEQKKSEGPIKILVVDDDIDMVDMLSSWLKGHKFDVVCALDGEQAIKRWRDTLPDLVILDIQIPKLNGFEVYRLMQRETDAKVLILTAYGSEDDEICGLELGADSYLRKPFSPRQLLAHIKAIMRRSLSAHGSSGSSAITVGSVTLDTMRHEVIRDGIKVRLTPTEGRLLHLLITHAGQVLTTGVIIEHICGYYETGDSSLVKTHINHLRQKVEPDPNNPQHIVTVSGVGYTFSAHTGSDSREATF